MKRPDIRVQYEYIQAALCMILFAVQQLIRMTESVCSKCVVEINGLLLCFILGKYHPEQRYGVTVSDIYCK